MSGEKPSNKAEIAEKLLELFREKGYEGVSLSDISAATGLGRASLYHHFPGGKAEMAAASLQCLGRWSGERLLPFAQGDTPAARLNGLIDGFNAYFDGGNKNCLLVMLSVSDAPPELAAQMQHMGGGLVQIATALFVDLGLPPENAAEEAERFFVELHGGAVMSRTGGDTGPFERTLKRLHERVSTLEKEYG